MVVFRYLGRIITATDDDWQAVVSKLRKARKKWERMPSILRREGGNARTYGNFFKAVMQEVLIFGLETWVETPTLEGL